VRDAGRQLADRGHLLGLDEALLRQVQPLVRVAQPAHRAQHVFATPGLFDGEAKYQRQHVELLLAHVVHGGVAQGVERNGDGLLAGEENEREAGETLAGDRERRLAGEVRQPPFGKYDVGTEGVERRAVGGFVLGPLEGEPEPGASQRLGDEFSVELGVFDEQQAERADGGVHRSPSARAEPRR
jgi:hypothetical protein